MEEDKKYIEEMEKIKEYPYLYICDYVESLYPKIGRRTFEVLALMPPSLIAPDLAYGSKKIRSNINALFLAPSGSGKSSIAKLFASFSYFPLEFESITAAKLEMAIAQCPRFSLVVGDFARMSRDPILIKVIEGILGEEKRVSRKTMRKDIDIEAEGIGLLCGISTDLSSYILSGLIFRTVPILISHNHEEHSDIGRHITDQIGKAGFEDKEAVIKDYYFDLLKIQNGANETIPPITGYEIPERYGESLYQAWNKLTAPVVKQAGFNFFRELQEGYRFLVSIALLNVFNRKVVNGILYPNDSDLEIALDLMRRSIIFKFRLIRSEAFAKGLKNSKQFMDIMNDPTIANETKEIIRNLVEIKGDKVVRKTIK